MPGPRNIMMALIFLAVLLLFIRLGAVSVFQVAEARNSQCAVEMMGPGKGIIPLFNGELRTDKPPLHYYFMMLAYRIVGINETGARFFSAVCGLLVILGTWLAVKRNQGIQSATWTCIILLSSLHVLFQFRLATPDPYLVACHVLSVFAFFEGVRTGHKPFFLLMYFLWALALLAKGPVGMLLPAATVFFFLAFTRRLNMNVINSMLPLPGLLIVLLVAMPWYVLVHQQTGGQWTAGFIFQHNISRFSNPMDGHRGPFILPLLFVLAGMFPFGIFSVRTIAILLQEIRKQEWLLLNFIAVCCVIVPYSFSATKLINYTSPAYPFVAVIIATFIVKISESKHASAKELLPEWVLVNLASIGMAIAAVYWLQAKAGVHQGWACIVLPIATLVGWKAWQKGHKAGAFALVAMGSVTTNLIFFCLLYPAIDASGSVRQLRSLAGGNNPLAAYQSLNDAFVFYHRQPIPMLYSAAQAAAFIKQHPDALILERSHKPLLADSLQMVVPIKVSKDLFSSQHSAFYGAKQLDKTEDHENAFTGSCAVQ